MCLLFDEILNAFFKSNRSAAPHGCYVECCSKHYLACQAEINILDGAGGVIGDYHNRSRNGSIRKYVHQGMAKLQSYFLPYKVVPCQ